MRDLYLTEVCELALQGLSAPLIIERLGLSVTPRTVQRWVTGELGAWPAQVNNRPFNWLKELVLAELVDRGLRRDYCAVESHSFYGEPFLRKLKGAHGLDAVVITCAKHSGPGDQ